MVTRMFLRIARLPGADTFLSFIGRRILGAFSLIRTAILVMGVANLLLFQYLDSAEAQERNKLAEQGKLDHLSFVVQTQVQSYESAVWQTGRLPATITSARDLYTSEATDDLQALRKLDRSLLAPGCEMPCSRSRRETCRRAPRCAAKMKSASCSPHSTAQSPGSTAC